MANKELGRNRIVEVREMESGELTDNAGNFRQHPKAQKDAFKGVVGEVGKAGALVAYYSDRNDGALTLIDGHMRKDFGGKWTVLITDLDDDDADKLLQTYDPISHMAVVDRDQLKVLRDRLEFSNKHVQAMVDTMVVPGELMAGMDIMPFEPNLMPTTSQTQVTGEEVAAVQAQQDGRFSSENLAKGAAAQKIEITCPHCAEDFFINKYTG